MMRDYKGSLPLDPPDDDVGTGTKKPSTKPKAKKSRKPKGDRDGAAAAGESRADRPWNQVRRTKKVVSAFGLSDADLAYLKKNTRYNEKEIK